MRSFLLAWILGTLVFATTPVAHANNRFPNAQNLVIGPGAEARVLVASTTFGFVLSSDYGLHWRWICEPAIGFDRTWDATLYLAPDSTIVAALPDGIAIAQPDYCSFARPATDPMREVIDLTGDPQGTMVVAALAPPPGPDGIAISNDRGQTWHDGWTLPGFFVDTIDVAPGHPSRVYASGYAPSGSAPVLYRSDNGGVSFDETTRDFHGGYDVWIAGVDPNRPDVIYVRSNEPSGGTYLLRSTDGGTSFQQLIHTQSQMLGFAASPDGQTLWVSGSGRGEGIFRSDDAGANWHPLLNRFTTLCLKYQAGVLFACSDYYTDGFALAASIDRGDNFAPILSFDRIDGSTSCSAGTPGHDLCVLPWSMVHPSLLRDAGTVDIDASFLLDGGGGSWIDTGSPLIDVPAEPRAVPEAGRMDGGAEAAFAAVGGCGCRTIPHRRGNFAAGIVTVLLVVRRRRAAPADRASKTAMR